MVVDIDGKVYLQAGGDSSEPAQKRFRIRKRTDGQHDAPVGSPRADPRVLPSSHAQSHRGSAGGSSSTCPPASSAPPAPRSMEEERLHSRLSHCQSEWRQALKQAAACVSGGGQKKAIAFKAMMKVNRSKIVQHMKELGCSDAKRQAVEQKMDEHEALWLSVDPPAQAQPHPQQQQPPLQQAAAGTGGADAESVRQFAVAVRQKQQAAALQRQERAGLERAGLEAALQARLGVAARLQQERQERAAALERSAALEKERMRAQDNIARKIKERMKAQAVAREAEQAAAAKEEAAAASQQLVQVEGYVAELRTAVQQREAALLASLEQTNQAVRTAEPMLDGLSHRSGNILRSVGKHLAKGMQLHQMTAPVLEWRLRSLSKDIRVQRMLRQLYGAGFDTGSMIDIITSATFDAHGGLVQPCYQLYAEIQIAFQSFCEFRANRNVAVWMIPQALPEVSPQPPRLEIEIDPLRFKVFDSKGTLDTASRFHALYSSMPLEASAHDVLCAMGRQIHEARSAIGLDAHTFVREMVKNSGQHACPLASGDELLRLEEGAVVQDGMLGVCVDLSFVYNLVQKVQPLRCSTPSVHASPRLASRPLNPASRALAGLAREPHPSN